MTDAKAKAAELQKFQKFPCEKQTHCCVCIPLKLGMQIFGVLTIIGAVLYLLGAI